MLTQDEIYLAQKYNAAWKTKEDFLKDLWEYRIFRDWWNQVNHESQVPRIYNQKSDVLMLIIVPIFVIFMYILFFQIINRLFYYIVLWTLFPKE